MSLIAGNLAVVQRLLDEHELAWGVCAGAAAHLYGVRRPIQDIDLLVERGGLPKLVAMLQAAKKAVQYDGRRILWRGIKFFDDLSVRRDGYTCPWHLDPAMRAHVRRLPLLGARVAVLAPEDVLVHKLLLGRGLEQGKHDLSDAVGIIQRQTIDCDYLHERLRIAAAAALVRPQLLELGVCVPDTA
jgi:hypothetical protein